MNNQMIDFNQYIGKSICINRDSYPVYLFNVREYNSDIKRLTAEQIVHSTCIIDYTGRSTCIINLEVYTDCSYYVDPEYDTVSIVCDTPDELLTDVVKYLKEQIKNRSGLQLS